MWTAWWLNPQVDSTMFAATVAAAVPSIVLPGRPGPPTLWFNWWIVPFLCSVFSFQVSPMWQDISFSCFSIEYEVMGSSPTWNRSNIQFILFRSYASRSLHQPMPWAVYYSHASTGAAQQLPYFLLYSPGLELNPVSN